VKRKFIIVLLISGFIFTTSGYEIQKQDEWNTTFEPGEEKNVGTLNIENTGNDTLQNVNLDFSGYPFITNARPNGFDISPGSTQASNIEFNIPAGFTAGNISGDVIVSGENIQTKSIEHMIKVENVEKWNLTGNDINGTLNSGDTGTLGSFNIFNSGNTDINFNINYTGSVTNFTNINEELRIFRGADRDIQLGYSVPSDLEQGNYNGTVEFITGNKSVNRSVSIDVVDNVNPNINEVNVPETIEATRPVNIEAVISDNVKVENAEIQFWYKTVNNTNKVDEVNFTQSDGNVYTSDYNGLSRTGDYLVKILATDTAGNTKVVERNMTLEGLNSIDVNENIIFPTAKSGNKVKEHLMYIDTQTPVTIELSDGQNFGTWSVGIIMPNGNRKFINNINESIQVNEQGNYSIVYESNTQGSYFGTLEYYPIEEHVSLNETSYSGEMTNYTVPESFEKTWVGDSKLECNVVDNGIREQSYRTCIVNYSLDESVEQNSVIPISPNRLEEFKESTEQEYISKVEAVNQTAQGFKTQRDSQIIQKWFLAFLIVGMSGYGYYRLEIKPYTRWRLW
jgi:hypothetical protein